MMNELRRFLIFLRKQRGTDFRRTVIILPIIMILSMIIAYLADSFISWNFFFNLLRGAISIIVALSIFSLIYVLIPDIPTEKDVILNLRKTLSQKQRINLSLLIAFISIVFNLLIVKAGSTIFTLSGGILFAIFFSLLVFVRPTHDEYLRYKNNIEDDRDIYVTEKENTEE